MMSFPEVRLRKKTHMEFVLTWGWSKPIERRPTRSPMYSQSIAQPSIHIKSTSSATSNNNNQTLTSQSAYVPNIDNIVLVPIVMSLLLSTHWHFLSLPREESTEKSLRRICCEWFDNAISIAEEVISSRFISHSWQRNRRMIRGRD